MAESETQNNTEMDSTPNTGTFQPAVNSTPEPNSNDNENTANNNTSSFNPDVISTPKKNIRFMDESVSKIHVYPSLPATPCTKKNIKNFSTSLPVIPDVPQPFNPILYTFRIPERWPKLLTHLRVRSPPFYLQLDHAIAVIWCMFSPSAKKTLGIAQLHWALSFLNSLTNRNHERPKDVQLCIEAIEDYLIELYADLSNKLEPLKNMERTQREEEEAPVHTEIPFSFNYSEMFQKVEEMVESGLAGGSLANYDDTFRREVEDLKEIAGTDSVELMTSRSREAAIDYLNDTRSRHLRNISKEVERIRSLDNLLNVISPDSDISNRTNNIFNSLLRTPDSSDANTSDFSGAMTLSDMNNTSEVGRGAE